MIEPTENTRVVIWEQFLEASAMERYYHSLSIRYQRMHRWTLIFLAFSAVVGIAPHIIQLPAPVKVASNMTVAAISVFGLVQNLPEKSAKAKSLYVQYATHKSECEHLWIELQNDARNNQNALRKFKELDKEKLKIEEAAQLSYLDFDAKLDKESWEVSDNFAKKQYQTNLETA